MRTATLVCSALLALGLGLAAPALQDPPPEVSVVAAGGSVSMLIGEGGNVGVSIGADGVLMIDDQYARMEPGLRRAIEDLGGGAPRFLVNTHWHGDHTGGNAVFAPPALVFAHRNVRPRMAAGDRRNPAAPVAGLPVVGYQEGLSLWVNGDEVQVIGLGPGHTDGDSAVWFPVSKVAHLGDQFFSGMFPFVDLESGGDVEGFLRNTERLLELLPADAKLIPGHGPLSTMDDLHRSLDMLRQTTAIVRERIAAGQSEEECIAAGLPDEWASWSWNFITTKRWLGTCYRSLRK